jgi:hypothetical protein
MVIKGVFCKVVARSLVEFRGWGGIQMTKEE